MILQSWRDSWYARVGAIISCLWAVAPNVTAQDTVCDPEQPDRCATPLREGDTA